ncbi:MAG: galactokinase [Bacteroidales bacterium]|nr:MAG: galactokinase [Bacteroidales bacterium]
METDNLVSEFYQRYGKAGGMPRIYFSPGRVNLIGEHTDYNGGYVFPCALGYGTYLLVRGTVSPEVRFASMNFDFTASVPLDKLPVKAGNEWINYPMGVFNEFMKIGVPIPKGTELLYYGDIPDGAGLSSSASIETVTAYMVNLKYGNNLLDMKEMALLCQRAENSFVGVNCGIMDQFAVIFGQEHHAIFLNCDNLDHELVPLKLEGLKLIISNTNKKRQLADSKYNERRGECETAVEELNKARPVRNLGELSLAAYEEISDHISNETVQKRARHVVSEDQRCIDAVTALKGNDMEQFGKLMDRSHDSLRDDYEVTGFELDTLVEEARKIEGVLGSRMTGAGFGGCTVTLIKENAVGKFIEKVGAEYKRKTGLKPDFYVADVGNGVREIKGKPDPSG